MPAGSCLFYWYPLPMQDDEFEWDDAKAKANLRKHKISFRAASRVFEDAFALIEQDADEDHG